jgi:hypothetical protein
MDRYRAGSKGVAESRRESWSSIDDQIVPTLERRHSWGGALQQWAEPEPLPVVALQGRLIPSASLASIIRPPVVPLVSRFFDPPP